MDELEIDPAYFRRVVQAALDGAGMGEHLSVTCEAAWGDIWRLDIWRGGKVCGGADFKPSYPHDADCVAESVLRLCREYGYAG